MSAQTIQSKTGVFARARRYAFAGVLATGTALALPALAGTASAATGPCPAVHDATGCGVIITINATAPFVTVSNPGNGNPYDGHDDTLVGVVNNSGVALSSLGLSSSLDIFGFDGDGVCTSTFTGDSYCSGLAKSASGYEGPDNTFSGISSDKKSGTADFTSALGGSASTWFSLENDLSGCVGETESATPQANVAETDCVTIPSGPVTIVKTDKSTGKSLNPGGSYSVYTTAGPHTSSDTPVATCTITTGGTCTTSALLPAGIYYVDETTAPAGYTAAAEQQVLVIGGATVNVADDPIPPPVVPPVVQPNSGTTTTTTTTAPAAAVTGATTVHTGESFAGSQPYLLAVLGAGFGLTSLGLVKRRRAQAAARR